MAAYLLDHLGFASVPPTVFVETMHDSFYKELGTKLTFQGSDLMEDTSGDSSVIQNLITPRMGDGGESTAHSTGGTD